MTSEVLFALAAMTAGIAVAGIVATARHAVGGRERLYLVLLFAAFAGIAAIPLMAAISNEVFALYLPFTLVLLLVLPPIVHHYIAVRTSFGVAPPLHWRDGILPAAALMTAIGFWMLPAGSRTAMIIEGTLPAGLVPSALALASFGLVLVWSLGSCVYLSVTLRRLSAFRARLKDLYSNTQAHELRWIDWLMAFLVLLWGAVALSLFGDNLGPGLVLPGEIAIALVALLLLFVIGFASIAPPAGTKSEVAAADTLDLAAPQDDAPASKYTRSALSPDHAKRLRARIEKAMAEDALYLDPNLSLRRLAHHVGALPNPVSQTLNEEIGSTFFDYVAHWRIEAAKPMILSAEASILSIALEVGFNTRSTFYKAFKRETGLTPKAFRDANRQ